LRVAGMLKPPPLEACWTDGPPTWGEPSGEPSVHSVDRPPNRAGSAAGPAEC